jgi:hypothetical protein
VSHLESLRHLQTAVLFERYPLSYCAILRSIFYKLPGLVDRWVYLKTKAVLDHLFVIL